VFGGGGGGGGGMTFAGLVSLTSYSSELLVLGGGWSASRVLLCVRVHRLGPFGFLWEREQVCEM